MKTTLSETPYLSGVTPAACSCCSVLKARAEKEELLAPGFTVKSFVPFLQFISRRNTTFNIN